MCQVIFSAIKIKIIWLIMNFSDLNNLVLV